MSGKDGPERSVRCFGKFCIVLMYMFNLFLLVGGISAIGVGVWSTVDDLSQRVMMLTDTDLYANAAITLISGGTGAIFLSIFGCFATRYENRCLVAVYCVILLMVLVTEFASGALALAFYMQIERLAHTTMRDGIMLKYGQPNHLDITDAFNVIQYEFDCCSYLGTGHDGAQLYQASLWGQQTLLRLVPASCCKRDDEGEAIDVERCQNVQDNDFSFINNIGCFHAVVDLGSHISMLIAAFGLGLSCMQFIGLIFAFCLFRQLN